MPAVSVIIPAYRAAHTIDRALNSALGQTCPPAQILVIDDGSPDDLAAAVRPYGDRVELIRKPNGGAASARNQGLDLARGQFVAFLDADDYWEPHKLEHQLRRFTAHPDLGSVAGRYFTQQPGLPREAPADPAGPFYDRILPPGGRRAFWAATKMQTSVVLARREVIGEHRFVSGLEPAEDRDLWARLSAAAPVYLIGEPLMTYVEEPNSLCRTRPDRDYGNMLRVVNRHRALLGRRGVREWEAETLRKWAARHIGNGHLRAALRPAWRRLLRQPASPEGWWILAKCGLGAIRGTAR